MTRSLRRFLREPDGPQAPPQERCELCATPVAAEHPHLVERRGAAAAVRVPAVRGAVHASRGRQVSESAGPVPVRYRVRAVPTAQWDELQMPVGMAFFLLNSIRRAVVACYPSPAGATESELPLDGVGGRGRGRPRSPE